MAEVPANQQYRERRSLVVMWPGVDKLVMLQFITFEDRAQTEIGDFIGLAETYSYTPPYLTKAMEGFINGLSSKK